MRSDDARKAYHREKVSGRQRYVSAYREKYSLASPFTERCFQLAIKDGFVGLITSNNFMKREFGKALVEKCFLRRWTLRSLSIRRRLISSVPRRLPTVLFLRAEPPAGDARLRVHSRRGEAGAGDTARLDDLASRGRVWAKHR